MDTPRRHAQQVETNLRLWQRGNNVSDYAHRRLRPVEVVIIARYRDAIAGRVLEVGCGAGRILGYLVSLGGEVHGVDVSEQMVAYCQERFPGASVRLGDLRNLESTVEGRFDAIMLCDNVLDVVDDASRRAFLSTARRLLTDDGLLIFSSHNLAAFDREPEASGPRARGKIALRKAFQRPLAEVLTTAVRVPRRTRNRRRMLPLEYRATDHAVLNDPERDFGVLHYYVRHPDQERQLGELGFELVECLDVEGDRVAPGTDGPGPWLHYVATATAEAP